MLKRMVDIVVSTMLLVALAPLLLLVSVAIRLTSPGPILFQQPRWGRDERPFTFFKFRTMRVASTHTAPPSGGLLDKRADDPRVTPLGRILRRFSIDELPQLWNVLRGDMSLVGPRPLMLHMLEPYPEIRRARCVVRPGLTGLWQVSSREHNTHVSNMIEWDMRYINKLSLSLDLQIIAKTITVVISGRGAV